VVKLGSIRIGDRERCQCAVSSTAMMQEHKSFLIRDLLGDVLAERVQGIYIYICDVPRQKQVISLISFKSIVPRSIIMMSIFFLMPTNVNN